MAVAFWASNCRFVLGVARVGHHAGVAPFLGGATGTPSCVAFGASCRPAKFARPGYGVQIVAEGSRAKTMDKWPLVLVSGEPEYYPKFGFVPATPYQLDWPGFIERERLQFLELKQGALEALRPPLRVRARNG